MDVVITPINERVAPDDLRAVVGDVIFTNRERAGFWYHHAGIVFEVDMHGRPKVIVHFDPSELDPNIGFVRAFRGGLGRPVSVDLHTFAANNHVVIRHRGPDDSRSVRERITASLLEDRWY